MYCPECGSEFREGFTECSDCRIPLVAAPPAGREPREDQEPVELETVLDSVNPALVAMAKSLLEGAGIDFVTAGEGSQIEFAVIPVRLRVESSRAEEARSLLADLEENLRLEEENEEPSEEE